MRGGAETSCSDAAPMGLHKEHHAMNITDILKTIGTLLSAGPTILQLVMTILQAFNVLPPEHQAAVSNALKAHMQKTT